MTDDDVKNEPLERRACRTRRLNVRAIIRSLRAEDVEISAIEVTSEAVIVRTASGDATTTNDSTDLDRARSVRVRRKSRRGGKNV